MTAEAPQRPDAFAKDPYTGYRARFMMNEAGDRILTDLAPNLPGAVAYLSPRIQVVLGRNFFYRPYMRI